jgi:hypothetical protein
MGEVHLQRVQPGGSFIDAYTAQAFNVFADGAEEAARLRKQFAAGGPPPRQSRNAGVVTVRNDTGADLDRYAVVGLGDPIIDNSENLAEFQGRVTFQGETPDIDLHVGKFAVLIEPLPDGKIGLAIAAGVCQVLLTVSAADDRYADIEDAETGHLTSGGSGSAQILWKETGTGSGKWAIVRLGTPAAESNIAWAKVQAGHVNFNAITGDPVRLASVKLLDDDGDEYGDAFDVYLPWASGKHPGLFAGDTIVVAQSVAGIPSSGFDEPVCLSDCSDDVFDTIKLFCGSTSDIPPGWALCDGTNGTADLTGRFVMGLDADGQSDENTIGDTGGYRTHGSSENNHSAHGQHSVTLTMRYVADSPDEVNMVADAYDIAHATEAHSDSDNRPRYYVLAYMQRVE